MEYFDEVEELYEEVYSHAIPVNVQDVGVCYYCGCEAEYQDFVPPKSWISYYLTSGESCSLAIIPTCKECISFLKKCRDGLVEERQHYINMSIGKKYQTALNIYERWNKDELIELEKSLADSVKAGLAIGEEAYERLRYMGFEYEIAGSIFHARRQNVKEFSVFEEKFDNFRNALQYAARSYKININTLKEWLMEYDTVFDDAINAYFEFQEMERARKKKKKLCSEFAKKHKQNSKFVRGALDAYMEVNPSLTIEACLILIYEERVKKFTAE